MTEELALRNGRSLTPRELEVARHVGNGFTNQQIARKLGISEWTVTNHMRQVMRKLDCSSRVQVARWAWANLSTEAEPGG